VGSVEDSAAEEDELDSTTGDVVVATADEASAILMQCVCLGGERECGVLFYENIEDMTIAMNRVERCGKDVCNGISSGR